MMDRPVIAAVDDLFFLTKIETAARQAGVNLIQARSARALDEQLDAPAVPRLVILDLNSSACSPFDAIRRIKADPRFQETRAIGFFSHVQAELETAAREAGCDQVLPRSVFSARLVEILKG
jgi:CheY-like chemotaxis protein